MKYILSIIFRGIEKDSDSNLKVDGEFQLVGHKTHRGESYDAARAFETFNK